MGEIGEMILDGILDEETGEYIDDEVSAAGGCGYPRRMNDSFDDFERQPSKKNMKNGLHKWLEKNVPDYERCDFHLYLNGFNVFMGEPQKSPSPAYCSMNFQKWITFVQTILKKRDEQSG